MDHLKAATNIDIKINKKISVRVVGFIVNCVNKFKSINLF